MVDERMGPTDVMAVLAHRYPFLLVDRIDVLDAGRRVEGHKQITANEWQMWGGRHAAMPSMLVVEALAQTSAALLLGLVDSTAGVVGYFAAIERVRIREPAVAGDSLNLSVELLTFRRGVARLKGLATVGQRRIVSARFTTIVRPAT